jgi:hypothetical protein
MDYSSYFSARQITPEFYATHRIPVYLEMLLSRISAGGGGGEDCCYGLWVWLWAEYNGTQAIGL